MWPSLMCVSGMEEAASSRERAVVKEVRAVVVRISGPWLGVWREVWIEGVKRRRRDWRGVREEVIEERVRRGRKSCVRRIGVKRCVFSVSDQVEAGIEARGPIGWVGDGKRMRAERCILCVGWPGAVVWGVVRKLWRLVRDGWSGEGCRYSQLVLISASLTQQRM